MGKSQKHTIKKSKNVKKSNTTRKKSDVLKTDSQHLCDIGLGSNPLEHSRLLLKKNLVKIKHIEQMHTKNNKRYMEILKNQLIHYVGN